MSTTTEDPKIATAATAIAEAAELPPLPGKRPPLWTVGRMLAVTNGASESLATATMRAARTALGDDSPGIAVFREGWHRGRWDVRNPEPIKED
jgi:hypothetical protein